MGSLGFESLAKQSWSAQDIDIPVPSDSPEWEAIDSDRIDHLDQIERIMHVLGYQLLNLHEYAFQKEVFDVEFGCMDTLPSFAGTSLRELLHEVDSIPFHLPNHALYYSIFIKHLHAILIE